MLLMMKSIDQQNAVAFSVSGGICELTVHHDLTSPRAGIQRVGVSANLAP